MRLSVADTVLPAAISDETLVQRLGHGEVAAGEALARRYYQPLLRYLNRLVSSEQVAEDLMQQTWLSVLEHASSFRADSGGFKAWVYRIASNKAHDYWRSNARGRALQDGLAELPVGEAAPASHRLQAAEQAERLRRAIEQLPEGQKQVLMLRYYGDLKFVEIARLLGCPLNTALGRMHKAMLKLRELLKD